MNPRVVLVVTSLLSTILFSIHWADDVVHGLDSTGIQNVGGFAILAVWLYATLLLPHRRWGLVILLLASVLAVGVAVLHLKGTRVGAIATGDGGFRFIWTLYALGGAGTFSFILALRGLLTFRSSWNAPSAQRDDAGRPE
jgi:hypothetical protein